MKELSYALLVTIIVFFVTKSSLKSAKDDHKRFWRMLRFPAFLAFAISIGLTIYLDRAGTLTKSEYSKLASASASILPIYFILYSLNTKEAISKYGRSGFISRESNPLGYYFLNCIYWVVLIIFGMNFVNS